MEEAGYDLRSQYLGLLFHLRHIAPRLGPAPCKNTPPHWKSFMTDDFSPLEYSWNWDSPTAPPKIRYSIEAIGPAAGTPLDPFNQASTLDLCSQVDAICPAVDWSWFELFQGALCDHSQLSKFNSTDDEHHSSSSSVFLAFELGNTIAAKAYFVPVKAEQLGVSRLSVLTEAIELLRSKYGAFEGYDAFLDFTTTSQGSKLDIIGVAIDCISPEKSRLKLYVRSPETSFESVCEMMTLGGRLNPMTKGHQDELRDLWWLTLGLNESVLESDELNPKVQETAGVLYNFDIIAQDSLPKPKLYVPIKHYAVNDLDAAQGLCEFLRRRNRDKYASNYMRALERSCTHRKLSDGLGFQTYIGTGFQKDGSLALCSYWNGEAYHPNR